MSCTSSLSTWYVLPIPSIDVFAFPTASDSVDNVVICVKILGMQSLPAYEG